MHEVQIFSAFRVMMFLNWCRQKEGQGLREGAAETGPPGRGCRTLNERHTQSFMTRD